MGDLDATPDKPETPPVSPTPVEAGADKKDTPEVAAGEKREAVQAESRDAREAIMPISRELLTFKRERVEPAEKAEYARIDKLFNQMKFADREHVDRYDNQRAYAIGAMKKYLEYTFKIMDLDLNRADTVEKRTEWPKYLNGAKEDIGNYYLLAAALLQEITAKSPNKEIGIDQMYEIEQKGNELFNELAQSKEYGETLQHIFSTHENISGFTDGDKDLIIGKFKGVSLEGMTARTAHEQLKEAGLTAMLMSMNDKQKNALCERMIQTKNPETMSIIASMTITGHLTIPQMESLFDKGVAAGVMQASGKAAFAEKCRVGQEAYEKDIKQRISENLRAKMSTNQAQRFFEPKFFAGFVLTVWRGINLGASVLAYRKDISELFGSEWFWIDIAGIAAGNALMGNTTITEFITQKTENETDKRQQAQELGRLGVVSKRYLDLSEKIFVKPGVVESIKEIAKRKKGEKITTADLIAELKRPDRQGALRVAPEILGELEKLEGPQKERCDILVDQIAKTNFATTHAAFEQQLKLWKEENIDVSATP